MMNEQEMKIVETYKLMLKSPYKNIKSILKIVPDDYEYWSILKVSDIPVEDQFKLTLECLESNPKSYQSWYHRLYLIKKHKLNIDNEINIAAEILKQDNRNFHVYGYMNSLGIGLNLCFDLFKEDLKNYSALHRIYKHVELDIESLILVDSMNEGLWLVYGFEPVKIYNSYFIIYFDNSFSGELEIIILENNKIKRKLKVYLKYELPFLKINMKINLNEELKLNYKNVSKIYKFVKNKNNFVEKMLSFEPNCVFALIEKMKYSDDNERVKCYNKLCEIDEDRCEYYKQLLENKYYIFKEI